MRRTSDDHNDEPGRGQALPMPFLILRIENVVRILAALAANKTENVARHHNLCPLELHQARHVLRRFLAEYNLVSITDHTVRRYKLVSLELR